MVEKKNLIMDRIYLMFVQFSSVSDMISKGFSFSSATLLNRVFQKYLSPFYVLMNSFLNLVLLFSSIKHFHLLLLFFLFLLDLTDIILVA